MLLSADQLLCYELASVAISIDTRVDIPRPAWAMRPGTPDRTGRADYAGRLIKKCDHTVDIHAAWVLLLSEMVSSGLSPHAPSCPPIYRGVIPVL